MELKQHNAIAKFMIDINKGTLPKKDMVRFGIWREENGRLIVRSIPSRDYPKPFELSPDYKKTPNLRYSYLKNLWPEVPELLAEWRRHQ